MKSGSYVISSAKIPPPRPAKPPPPYDPHQMIVGCPPKSENLPKSTNKIHSEQFGEQSKTSWYSPISSSDLPPAPPPALPSVAPPPPPSQVSTNAVATRLDRPPPKPRPISVRKKETPSEPEQKPQVMADCATSSKALYPSLPPSLPSVLPPPPPKVLPPPRPGPPRPEPVEIGPINVTSEPKLSSEDAGNKDTIVSGTAETAQLVLAPVDQTTKACEINHETQETLTSVGPAKEILTTPVENGKEALQPTPHQIEENVSSPTSEPALIRVHPSDRPRSPSSRGSKFTPSDESTESEKPNAPNASCLSTVTPTIIVVDVKTTVTNELEKADPVPQPNSFSSLPTEVPPVSRREVNKNKLKTDRPISEQLASILMRGPPAGGVPIFPLSRNKRPPKDDDSHNSNDTPPNTSRNEEKSSPAASAEVSFDLPPDTTSFLPTVLKDRANLRPPRSGRSTNSKNHTKSLTQLEFPYGISTRSSLTETAD